MKKWRIVALIIAVAILVVGSGIGATYFFKNPKDYIYGAIGFVLDNTIGPILEIEEKANQKKLENGEPIVGKDTRLIWGKMYEIGVYHDGVRKYKDLTFSTKEAGDRVLDGIIGYEKENGKLYVYSEEGYAVIDKNNLCRVYIIIPPELYDSGYWVDMYGDRNSYSKVQNCDKIQYLSSFSEYTEEEQKILKRIRGAYKR